MADEKYLLTVKEAAHLTGLSEGWWKQVTAGKRACPARVIKIGKAVRIHAGDLRAWIDGEKEVSPAAQQKQKRRRGRPPKAESIARERLTTRQE